MPLQAIPDAVIVATASTPARHMPRSKSAKNSPPVRSRVRKAPGYKAPDSVDYQALATFRLELRQFLAFSEANARRNRLTSQQYQALLTIRGLSGPTQCMSVGELAGLLLIRNHTAVELVARMAKIGLLKRFADAAD